jgi:hypothetical protein
MQQMTTAEVRSSMIWCRRWGLSGISQSQVSKLCKDGFRSRSQKERVFAAEAELPEWSNGSVLKSVVPLTGDRRFESSSLQRRDGMGQAARRWHHRRCI